MIYFIICVFSFFVLRKLMYKIFPKLPKSANIAIGVLAIVLTPFITKLVLLLFLNLILFEYHPDRSFSTNKWKEQVQDRYEMSKDLIDSRVLYDKTKIQIVENIGLPNDKIKIETDTLSSWRYFMGSRGWGFGLKFYYLNIEFENGKSIEIETSEVID